MSLQVWLPLTKDLRNQGLINWTPVIQSGTTSSFVNGKLGKALNTGGVIMPANVTKQVLNNNEFSYAGWLYVNGETGSTTERAMIFGNNNSRRFSVFQYPSANDLHWSWYDMKDGTNTFLCGSILYGVLPSNQWTHIAMTYKNPNGKIYINGELKTTFTGNYTGDDFNYDTQLIHNSPYHYLNDVRLYNHCLSPMEVKQISQGLVLHYPLDNNGWGQENIAKNSDKIYNWGFNSIGQLSNTLINDNGVAKFTLVKNTSTGQAGNYWTYNRYTDSLSNFVEGEIYTLSLFIKSDTQHTIALAGLYESQTRVATCGDNVVTSEWKNFWVTFTWTSTAKMTICLYFQNVEANSTINYWVKNLKLEKGDKITPWCPNSSDELATTMGMNDGIEYDTSGFGNNGTKTANLDWSSNTPKYTVSTVFNSTGRTGVNFPNEANPREKITIALWGYKDNWNVAERLGGKAASSSGWCIGDYGTENTMFGFFLESGNGSYNTISGFRQLSSGWHHFAITFDGFDLKYYLDSECISTKTWSTQQYLKVGTGDYNLGSHTNNSYYFNGNLSDFRIYATALSASDVLSLYQNSAYIDSSGNVYGAVHTEV